MSAQRPTAPDRSTRRARRKDLEARLAASDASETTPPADLLARLKHDLADGMGAIAQDRQRPAAAASPSPPAAAPASRRRALLSRRRTIPGASGGVRPPTFGSWRALAAAASVSIALLAGLLAVRNLEEPGRSGLVPETPPARVEALDARPGDGHGAGGAQRTIGSTAAPPPARTAAPAAARPVSPAAAPMSPEARSAAPDHAAANTSDRAVALSDVAPGVEADVPEGVEIVTTGESPLLDSTAITGGAEVTVTELEEIPTARAPWAVMRQTPPVRTDTAVVGGNESGQSSAWVGSGRVAPPAPAAPNGAAYDAVHFESAGTNPFVDTREDRLSTFGLDVDTGSYTVARRYLLDGHLPPPAAIRVEEFVNAQVYRDLAAPPRHDERRDDGARRGGNQDFTLRLEAAPAPFVASPEADRYRLVRLSLRARSIAPHARRPVVLTLVVDTSGSMAREDRLGLVIRALGALLDDLRPGDRVGLVAYDDRARLLLEPTTDRERARRSIELLRPGGSTNAEEGLVLAYEVAGRSFDPDATNRVLLASDGVANVGQTGPEAILERIGREARRGILLSTVGFGMGNYNDVLMERLADRGDGIYAYVDGFAEAHRVFREQLDPSRELVARDAKAQVEFDPSVIERWRLLGYENRDIADRDFRNDRVDAGEMAMGHAVTALYEVKLTAPASGDRRNHEEDEAAILVRLRYRRPGRDAGGEDRWVEATAALGRGDLLPGRWPRFAGASFDLRLAAIAAQFAEKLAGSYWSRDDSWADLEDAAQALAREARRLDHEPAARVEELSRLVSIARRLAEGTEEHSPAPERERR